MKKRLVLALSLCAIFGVARADDCAPSATTPANSTALMALTSSTNPVLDSLSIHGGHLLAPPKPSADDTGFSGGLYLGGMTTNSPGSPSVASAHLGGSFSNSISDTRNTFPTSFDIEYNPSSAPKVDEVILQTSPSSTTHSNDVVSSPATLKTRVDPGPGHDMTAAATFVNDSINKDLKKGKLDYFADAGVNALGPYYAIMQQDGGHQYGIEAADASATVGVRMAFGHGSTLILSHTEEVTASETDGQARFRLMSDQLHTTRLTLRHGPMSYSVENDCQKYGNETARSCDWMIQVSHQIGN